MTHKCAECSGTGYAEIIQGWERPCDVCRGNGAIGMPRVAPLVEFATGRPYSCGGKTLPSTVFLDTSRVIAVKAEVSGRMRSVILLEGGHSISVDFSPEETVRALAAQNMSGPSHE